MDKKHTILKKRAVTRGFTLVETLVAISVLVLAVTGAFTAAQSGISSYIFSKNQVIAFYLAAEGMEQIRNLRDGNGLNGVNWLEGIASSQNDPCFFDSACTVDPLSPSGNFLERCDGTTCDALRQDLTANSPTNGFYGYNPLWSLTGFRREVRITSVNPNEVSVLVSVTWSKGPVTRQFKIRENIFNWQ